MIHDVEETKNVSWKILLKHLDCGWYRFLFSMIKRLENEEKISYAHIIIVSRGSAQPDDPTKDNDQGGQKSAVTPRSFAGNISIWKEPTILLIGGWPASELFTVSLCGPDFADSTCLAQKS